MKNAIINLTQHVATPIQTQAGVFEPADKELVRSVLTFRSIPTMRSLQERANILANVAVVSNAKYAMIGGAPYLMAPLESALLDSGITPLYSFTERVSVDTTAPDGTVTKTSVFQHAGWVEVTE